MSLGMGFGIGIFCLISQWKAWGHLAGNGSATWDESEGHLVVHLVVHDGFQWWHLGETAFAVVLVSVLLYLNGMLLLPYLNTLQPDGPGMSDEG